MSELTIDIAEHDAGVIVRLAGSADMTAAQDLRHQLERLPTEETNRIVLDLSALDFISSMGLGVLIQFHRQCQEGTGGLRLANPQESIVKVLETTQLDQLFDIYTSLDEALSP